MRRERTRSILSLGCATGEEPYSLAIILLENFSFRLRDITVRIVGIDLDAECLKQAREALYRPEQLTDVAPRTKKRFFIREGESYRLVDEVKKFVRFKQGDVFRDRIADYANYFDLIVCRNVLIYFTRQEHERVLAKFEEALKEGGFLVLGKSESLLGRTRHTFKAISPRESIYQKKYRKKKRRKRKLT